MSCNTVIGLIPPTQTETWNLPPMYSHIPTHSPSCPLLSSMFSESSCKWSHMIFVFSAWLISLDMMPSRFIHAFTNDSSQLFVSLKTISLHRFLVSMHIKLIPYLGCWEKFCSSELGHGYPSAYRIYNCFYLSTRQIARSNGGPLFYLLRNLHSVL